MKATEAKLTEILKKAPQFIIPIYQRSYSWTKKECGQLWEDIIKAGEDDKTSGHFMGSVVYIEKDLYQIATHTPLLVIDGQQRLTTVTLLIIALADALGDKEPFDGLSSRKLRNYFLLNPEESGEKHYKLILSQTDKSTLISILDGKDLPENHSIKISENYKIFQELIKQNFSKLEFIWKGLLKLMVVDVSLTRGQDNPQLIFESMNSTGKELSQADLIRNYILMGLEPEQQANFYEKYWRPMEVNFGQEGYSNHFDSFMRHFLTSKNREIPKINDVYETFKIYFSENSSDLELLIKEIFHFSGYFRAIALGGETNKDLKNSFQDLRELKVDVAMPTLLDLYHDYKQSILSLDDFLKILRLIESYVFRRAVCSIPTNSMNKTFESFTKELDKGRYYESVQAVFLLLPSYRRFPSDEEFLVEIKKKDMYAPARRSYWLRRFENFDRKERVPVEEYTIEHIMPQNPNLSKDWKSELGADWQRIHQTYMHTLGNLTLTAYNSQLSDRPFMEKRDMKGGFAESPLRLNRELAKIETWNEIEIQKRADILAKHAIKVWPSPVLKEDILESFRPSKAKEIGYSLENHEHLNTEPNKTLFENLKSAILGLDPCVTENVLKLYIAFKADTNFVDIIPQAKLLRLTLNIEPYEIDDPKEICKDVTGLGRWGNGNTQVTLKNLDEIPYVIGLIRQAFEKQMDES